MAACGAESPRWGQPTAASSEGGATSAAFFCHALSDVDLNADDEAAVPEALHPGGALNAPKPDTPSSMALPELYATCAKLRRSATLRVRRRLEVEMTRTATTFEFAAMAMATVAGTVFARACYDGIRSKFTNDDSHLPDFTDDSKLTDLTCDLIAQSIYAAVATIMVPVVEWFLRHCCQQVRTDFLSDQARLILLCGPKLLAWAWKDVVRAAHRALERTLRDENVFDEVRRLADDNQCGTLDLYGLLAKLVVAGVITSLVAVAHASPWYQHAATAARLGEGGYIYKRVPAIFSSLGLAVGYAWMKVFQWAPHLALHCVEAAAYKFMLKVLYYLLVTAALVLATARHMGKVGEQEPCPTLKRAAAMDDLEMVESGLSTPSSRVTRITTSVKKAGFDITMSTMHFIHAWALRDLARALFFTYLLAQPCLPSPDELGSVQECDSNKKTPYNLQFVFAVIVSLVCARAAMVVKFTERRSARDKAFKSLLAMSLSLNTGWAWADFCMAAIDNSMGERGEKGSVETYSIVVVFVWLLISFLHRGLEVERRAREEHYREEALVHAELLR